MDSIGRKQCYKNLLDRGSELRLTADDANAVTTINQVSNMITESNFLNNQASPTDHANNTSEVVMDAQVMKMGHELLGAVINKIGCTEFSDEEYFTAILAKVFADDSINWNALADISIKVAKTTKFSPCLLGSFKHDPVVAVKSVKERQQRRKTTQSQVLRPEEVSRLEKQDKGAQKLNVALMEILKIYKETNQQPIPYYKLIIDPDSVMRTIDNSFQVAFLVSNGSVALETDELGLPAVRPVVRDKSNTANVVPVQAASNITTEICKRMIKLYKIREPLLKLSRVDDENSVSNASQRR